LASHDAVELSRRAPPPEAPAAGGVEVNEATGVYSLRLTGRSDSLQALWSDMPAADTSPAGAGGAVTPSGLVRLQSLSRRNAANFSPGAIRARLVQAYTGLNGAPTEAGARFTSVGDWLQCCDPEAYGVFLLLLELMQEENPAAAEGFLQTMEGLRDSLGGVDLQALDETSFSILQVNLEATLTAARVSGPAPGGGGGADLAAASLTIRVSGEAVHIRLGGEEAPAQGDPLVLDLAGDGIDLRGAEEGVSFDLQGTGTPVRTAFVRGDDALLYLDANGNGVADDGRELFGDQEGDAHGFAELARHDADASGAIDAADPVWEALRLWRDVNGDGRNQPQESASLPAAGIARLHLDYADRAQDDGKGNTLAQVGRFTRRNGTTSLMADALLRYYG
jgi:hypothetical protein